MHHCDNFRHVSLLKWILRDVPSSEMCYLSKNKNRIQLASVSSQFKDDIQFVYQHLFSPERQPDSREKKVDILIYV